MKKLIALIVALCCLPLSAAARPVPFSDVPADAWYGAALDLLLERGLVSGFPDGTFRPQQSVTRAEFCALTLADAVSADAIESARQAGEPWHTPYMAAAIKAGALDADANPNAPMPRLEAARFLWALAGQPAVPTLAHRLSETLSDWAHIPADSQPAVLWALHSGMMVGLGDGRFAPEGVLNRAQATILAARRLGLGLLPVTIPALVVDDLSAATSSSQIITVTTASLKDTQAVVNVYEQVDGVWLRVYRDLPAVAGIKGLMENRKQSTLTAPVGDFGIVFAFGAKENPGVHADMEYRGITPDSYWVLDSSSLLYNRWTEGRGDFKDREHLQSFGYQYNYALVLDFNYHNPVKGDGGAIFMHVATYDGKGTAGCIGLSESDLLGIMRWLDPGANPRVIICPEGDLGKY